MGAKTKIEWTDSTWSVSMGCDKISSGCAHCYAEAISLRFFKNFDLRLTPHKLVEPLKWCKPRMIFCDSMSDLFHKDIPTDYIRIVFKVMELASWHTFQTLTKRPERMRELLTGPLAFATRLENAWFGVSVENRRQGLPRVDLLRETPVKTRFLSVEPLLEDLGQVDLAGISWVICGGEGPPGRRPMREEWVLSIRDQCKAAGVNFLFKQWGPPGAGRLLEGQTWDQYPARVTYPVPGRAERLAAIAVVERLAQAYRAVV